MDTRKNRRQARYEILTRLSAELDAIAAGNASDEKIKKTGAIAKAQIEALKASSIEELMDFTRAQHDQFERIHIPTALDRYDRDFTRGLVAQELYRRDAGEIAHWRFAWLDCLSALKDSTVAAAIKHGIAVEPPPVVLACYLDVAAMTLLDIEAEHDRRLTELRKDPHTQRPLRQFDAPRHGARRHSRC